MMRGWKYIMIHHSATVDSDTYSWDAIRRYHMETNKWSDIGYHFGVEQVGGHFVMLKGRSLDTDGAHCKEHSMNRLGLGVCLVGDYDKFAPKPGAYDILVSLVNVLQMIYDIPVENVVAHRDYAPYKSCPGKMFNMDTFRNMLKAR